MLQGAEASCDDSTFLWHLYPVADSEPPVVHAYGIDVSRQREVERELEATAARAEQIEFSQRRLLEEIEGSFRARLAAIAVLETVLDVVADQLALGVADRVVDGVELLREVEAGPAFLEHGDDRGEMAVSAPEARDDAGMRGQAAGLAGADQVGGDVADADEA